MFSRFFIFLSLLIGLELLSSNLALADWRDEVKELKIGLSGGENEADRLKIMNVGEYISKRN